VSQSMDRREALRIFGMIPLVAAGLSPADVIRASTRARAALAAGDFTPAFFTPHEWDTVRVLAELVIPRDARSGGALDAGVPEFMDFMMTDRHGMQTPMRGGLAWLDAEAEARFGRAFVDLLDVDRRRILDDIAWPRKARPELSQGVAFFNHFRDLTASGFFSSKMGVEDLQYIGNTVVAEWDGCPPAALEKLGVRYS
jgi:Gluconate 2-dehydrogenase subunit 3